MLLVLPPGYVARIVVPEGTQEVKVGTPLGVIVENEEDVGKFKSWSPTASSEPPKADDKSVKEPASTPAAAPASAPQPSKAPSATPASSNEAGKEDRVFSSPLARKTASELGVSVNNMQGSGPRGRVVKSDVTEQAEASKSSGGGAATASHSVSGSFVDHPVSLSRKAIAGKTACCGPPHKS